CPGGVARMLCFAPRLCIVCICCCFFSSRRPHTSSNRDWSSDVCSSDLCVFPGIHSHQDHGIILVPCRLKKTGIHICAYHREKKQDMKEYLVSRNFPIQFHDPPDHNGKI